MTTSYGTSSFNSWEYIERTSKRANKEVDGIDVVATVKYKNKPSKIVLIANYRPAIDRYIIEFPAGLVESGDETADARRELREETGYTAKPEARISRRDGAIPILSPILYGDPWKSTEASKVAVLEIDGDDEVNLKVRQTLEITESIEVHLVDVGSGMMNNILELCRKHDYSLEAKVYTYALGISMASTNTGNTNL